MYSRYNVSIGPPCLLLVLMVVLYPILCWKNQRKESDIYVFVRFFGDLPNIETFLSVGHIPVFLNTSINFLGWQIALSTSKELAKRKNPWWASLIPAIVRKMRRLSNYFFTRLEIDTSHGYGRLLVLTGSPEIILLLWSNFIFMWKILHP